MYIYPYIYIYIYNLYLHIYIIYIYFTYKVNGVPLVNTSNPAFKNMRHVIRQNLR